ncbi:hypothetical protein ABGB08_02285 [Acrocarpospora sp. B8E8]
MYAILRGLLPVALVVAGLVFFTAGAWILAPAAGCLVAGLSCLYVEWATRPAEQGYVR